MKKVILIILLFLPIFALAQSDIPKEAVFKARILEIIAEEGNAQNLKLIGENGDYVGKKFEFNGINNLDVISQQVYEVGERVLVAVNYSLDGEPSFYVIDFVRTSQIWILFVLFFVILIFVGRLKGLRSIIALMLTFFVIIKYIIPQILSGTSPVIVTLIGSFAILLIIIYITEGFKAQAHLAVISIGLSLITTIIISSLFIGLARLTGAASEDVLFLFDIEGVTINLAGLLLAGIIIGALGVLDDVVIAQVATVEEIKKTDSSLDFKSLYKKAHNVGVSHIASMTNTLFLAYAGVSLPLLILFVSGGSAFNSLSEAINTELIATEIIRTLSGSIGLILAVPIATFIASKYYSRK
jgi:uncharacterized membrane protein